MKNIKVKTPAKINLTLKVGKRRPDGFHPIESIMQAISLYDYLEISACEGRGEIKLDGTSKEIPYDSANIAYKAARKYMEISGMEFDVNIYIEKNIPVCAGLAGGSTNAAGVLFALNKLYGLLNDNEIFNICKTLGSDLNFCMKGSKQLCRGKGDEMTPLDFDEFALTLVKPKKLKISTKEAYSLFDDLQGESNMPNDLEFALLPHYGELRKLHALGFQMSGSGPTYFVKKALLDMDLGEGYTIIENLHAINHGVCEI
mgnify:FL=1